eukprot:3097257-Pleurochrysis_carterae.AAC.1
MNEEQNKSVVKEGNKNKQTHGLDNFFHLGPSPETHPPSEHPSQLLPRALRHCSLCARAVCATFMIGICTTSGVTRSRAASDADAAARSAPSRSSLFTNASAGSPCRRAWRHTVSVCACRREIGHECSETKISAQIEAKDG